MNFDKSAFINQIKTVKTCSIDQMSEVEFMKACMANKADSRITDMNIGGGSKDKNTSSCTSNANNATNNATNKSKSDDDFYPMDLKSSTNFYELWIDVPGYNRDGICVTYADKHLTIKGLLINVKKVADLTISHRNNRDTFTRIVKLNTPIMVEAIYKEVKDGVLYLRIPKNK